MTPQTIYTLPKEREIVTFQAKEAIQPFEKKGMLSENPVQETENTDDIVLRIQQIQAIIQDRLKLDGVREALGAIA
jgi:hypothetical protein